MADIIQVALRGSRRGFFLNSRGLILQLRDRVIVQTDHGETLGSIFLKDPRLIELKRPTNVTREIIRKATEEDLDQEDHNRVRETEAFEHCKQRIAARDLPMELAETEVAFGGNRITFYFSADQRVDFRELVKDLAAKFRARIELRQIGRREQAKRLDGCGPCGRPLCCSTWLKDFHPVTLKMAREQQLSLNPSKISGACGRLMCCLAYELAQYRDSAQRLPPVGAVFRTGQGPMTVTKTDVFHEAVWVKDDEGAEHRIAYDEMPPGPYKQCGDCNCGKRGNGGSSSSGGGSDSDPQAGGGPDRGGNGQGGDGSDGGDLRDSL